MKRWESRKKMVFTTLVTGMLSENGPKNLQIKFSIRLVKLIK